MSLKRIVISISYSILFLYGILLLSALFLFDFDSFAKVFSSPRLLHALWMSIAAASIASLLALIMAIPAAYALSRYSFRLKSFVDIILELPMIISPAALGALILIFFQTRIGAGIRGNFVDVVYTFWGIVLAQFFTVLGIATRTIKAVFDEIPKRYENIARTLGAKPVQAFNQVVLPLSKQGLFAAIVLTWAKAIGEFGATITVAGSMSMKTETLPTAIFMALSSAKINETIILILILFTISISILLLSRLAFSKNTLS